MVSLSVLSGWNVVLAIEVTNFDLSSPLRILGSDQVDPALDGALADPA